MRKVGCGVWTQSMFAIAIAMSAGAQERPSLVLGVAPFLTRDRGWNFEHNLGASVGVEELGSRVGVRLLATFRLGARFGYGYDAIYLPSPQSAKNGMSVGLHVRTAPTIGGLYMFAGPERYQGVRPEDRHDARASGSRRAASLLTGTSRGRFRACQLTAATLTAIA